MEAEIIRALGGRRAFGAGSRQVDLLAEVERGIPVKAYGALAKVLGLTPAEEDRLLQVSLRTRVRWRQRSRLDPATSDRVVRTARILALATDVLENQAHAIGWLREPTDALNGRTPLQAISSDFGAERVANLLYQMEYGIYS
jgi:putative toxin-antitoxin system antitoxin component (TIGR02293 family)